MAATHTAIITEEAEDFIVRFPKPVHLTSGEAFFAEDPQTGNILLFSTTQTSSKTQDSWLTFLDDMRKKVEDPSFLSQRPGNRIPCDRNLFPDE